MIGSYLALGLFALAVGIVFYQDDEDFTALDLVAFVLLGAGAFFLSWWAVALLVTSLVFWYFDEDLGEWLNKIVLWRRQ